MLCFRHALYLVTNAAILSYFTAIISEDSIRWHDKDYGKAVSFKDWKQGGN